MYKVYKNLHNGMWSIASVETGLVVGHADIVLLENTTLVVSEAGRQRVLKERRKNVHAYIVGDILHTKSFKPFKGRTLVETGRYSIGLRDGERISYNPYRGASFFNKVTGESVTSFAYVMMGQQDVVGYRGNSPC